MLRGWVCCYYSVPCSMNQNCLKWSFFFDKLALKQNLGNREMEKEKV